MPFVAWAPPSAPVLELRGLARRITAWPNARDAIARMRCTRPPKPRRSWRMTSRSTCAISSAGRSCSRDKPLAVIRAHADLQAAFDVLRVGARNRRARCPPTAARALVLPPGMTVRQWVAQPASIPARIGPAITDKPRASRGRQRTIRRVLYMRPRGGATQRPCPCLLHEARGARGKDPAQAYVAVMREAPARDLRHAHQAIRPSSARSFMRPLLDGREYLGEQKPASGELTLTHPPETVAVLGRDLLARGRRGRRGDASEGAVVALDHLVGRRTAERRPGAISLARAADEIAAALVALPGAAGVAVGVVRGRRARGIR